MPRRTRTTKNLAQRITRDYFKRVFPIAQWRRLLTSLKRAPPAPVGAQHMKQQVVDRAVAIAGMLGIRSLVQFSSAINQAQRSVPMIGEQRLNIEAAARRCGHVGHLLILSVVISRRDRTNTENQTQIIVRTLLP